MNIVKATFFFSVGFLAGAHKYHLEYYCPERLNPCVIKTRNYPVYDEETEDNYMHVCLKNENYYKDLEEKMKAFAW